MGKLNTIDMTKGPIFGKIWLFSLPIIASGILQLLYNAADIIVVGRVVGKSALAAVGCTLPMINLIVNLFMGLSVGSSVLVSQLYGASRNEELPQAARISMILSIFGGIIIGIIGFLFARPLLLLMGTPESVIDQAVLYVRIYFCGMPAMGLYNFGSAVLRGIGDTRRPMVFLMISGIVNVILNLFFVIVLKIGVAGVALATVISQIVAAVFTLVCIIRSNCFSGMLSLGNESGRKYLKLILMIGVPAGLQGTVFSLSNVVLQSAINSFGDVVVAGSSAGSSLDGFVYMALDGVAQAAITFTAQNAGAGNYMRIRKGIRICVLVSLIIWAVLLAAFMVAGKKLLGFYNTEPDVISAGMLRVLWLVPTYFLCAFMGIFAGAIRGMGHSLMPTVVTIIGACGLRILWISTVFKMFRYQSVIYASYPITWAVTAAVHLICFEIILRKKLKLKKV